MTTAEFSKSSPARPRRRTARPDSAPSENGSVAKRSKEQGYEYREILRSQINPAVYNPREISGYARKQLRKSLTKFGLVEPLVWNEQSGILVSGHQRLSLLDESEKFVAGDPTTDYKIGVAVVDLNLKRERELNIWLQ